MSQKKIVIDKDFIKSLRDKTNPLNVNFLITGLFLKDLPFENAPEFAFVGRSNVGKSSFLNFISGQRNLARVSHTPGRTQTINLFSVEDKKLIFADLPGYGYAESPRETQRKWQSAMTEYFEKRRNLVGVVFLVDIRRDINEIDTQLSMYFQSIGLKVIVIETKIDKINKSMWKERKEAQAKDLRISPRNIVGISSQSKIGLNQFYECLSYHLSTTEK